MQLVAVVLIKNLQNKLGPWMQYLKMDIQLLTAPQQVVAVVSYFP